MAERLTKYSLCEDVLSTQENSKPELTEEASKEITPILQFRNNTPQETVSNPQAIKAGTLVGMGIEDMLRNELQESTTQIVEKILANTGHFFTEEARENVREVMENALYYVSTQANPKEDWESLYDQKIRQILELD